MFWNYKLKNIVLLNLLLLFASAINAQYNTVHIEILDSKLQPIAFKEVFLQEESSYKVLKNITDAAGNVTYKITEGRVWYMVIDGFLYDRKPIKYNPEEESETSFSFTHNVSAVKRLKQQTFNRTGFKDVQTTNISEIPAKGYCNLTITITNADNLLQKNKKVSVVNVKEKLIYTSITNSNGNCTFQLPLNKQYDIDVEEYINAGSFDVDANEGYSYTQTIVYDTYNVLETNSNDTITQKIKLPVSAKNSRALYTIKIEKADGRVHNEKVFLNDVNSNIVYQATTNKEGEALFILPFGKKYLINFSFQKDIDVIDLTDSRGRASGNMTVTYSPDPALEFPEKYIPQLKQLYLQPFEYFHITPYQNPAKTKPSIVTRWGNNEKSVKSNKSVLEIGIAAGIRQLPRLPLNISFVLDRSGSMAGNERIESLIIGMIELVKKLDPNDVVSILLYDDEPAILQTPVKVTASKKEEIIQKLSTIKVRGGTNVIEALKQAYDIVQQNYNAKYSNVVVVLSDGYDVNSADTLVAVQKKYNAGIRCTTIGVGKDYNYDLLKKLSTNGKHHFANEGKELEKIVSRSVLGLSAPIAKNIKISVAFPPDLQVKKAYGFTQWKFANNNFQASIIDLFENDEKPVFIEFASNNTVEASKSCMITIQYNNPINNTLETITNTVQLQNISTNNQELILNTESKKMYAIAFVNNCLINMATAFENNHITKAKQEVEIALNEIKVLYGSLVSDKDILELLNQLKKYKNALHNVEIKRKM